MKLFKWAKLTKANGKSNHLISLFSPFSSLHFGTLWWWVTSFSFWSLQPRTMGLCCPWPAVGKRATLESSDWKSANIGLPVELRMPSFQNVTQITSWCFTSGHFYCFQNQSKSILQRNFRESLVLSSLYSQERRLEVRDCWSLRLNI